jgi:hypothetical protein
MVKLVARGYQVRGEAAPAPPGQLSVERPGNAHNRRICYPYWFAGPRGERIEVPKISTVILGVMGSIPDAAVRSLEAVGAADRTLWRDLSQLLAADLSGSLCVPRLARRNASSSSAPLPATGVG